MIEANCVACGTLNRIAESDVPPGAKFVTCTSCKSRVAMPAVKTTQLPTPPPMPPKLGGVPPIPKMVPPVPKVPAPAPKPAATAALELADLPAPKRASPLGGDVSKPAPKSGLAAALDEDLPAPRPKSSGSAALDLDDLIAPAAAKRDEGISDLPAPKPRASALDLPAPKSRPTPLPSSMSKALEPQGADLPAPKARSVTPPAGVAASTPPRPGGARALTDFDIAPLDLPAPKPVVPAAPAKPGLDLDDLPAPKPAAAAPATSGAFDLELDLPAPKAVGGDVAPKGFFDDLPQPAAPKAVGGDVAPKGFFDDLPQPSSAKPPGDVAPKGFFDDLPQPSSAKPPGDVAPKGFFDDLPQPSSAKPPGDVAPKGFFDDLPQPSRNSSSEAMSLDLGDSLDMPELEPTGGPSGPQAPGSVGTFDALDLAGDMPSLELETPSLAKEPVAPAASSSAASSFDDLDLGAPSVGPAAKTPAPPPREEDEGIRFDKPKAKPPGAAAKASPLPTLSTKPSSNDLALELEEPREQQPKITARTEKAKVTAEERAKAAAASKKKRNLLAAAALGAVLVGGGGFFFYKRHAAAQALADEINDHVSKAKMALAADNDQRWQRAGTEAAKVLELEPKNGVALGISAEAAIAGAFADGKNQSTRFARGRKLISDALAAGVTGPELDRAQALSALTSNPAQAAQKIQALLQRTPNDAALQLYLGWAFEAAGDLAAATKAYDAATAQASVKVMALLGRARVKLAQADVDGAKADFDAILAINKDHIPAQVGLAATLPSSKAMQQEADLLAVLARKDIGTADVRAVSQAWVLAGDIARRAGRLDAARERYRKALEIDDKDLGAGAGLAEVEMRDGKLGLAGEQITKVLTQSPDNANAQLIAAELSILQKLYDDAGQRLDVLAKRTPPLPALDQARLYVVTGKLREAREEHDAAADAFVEAAKIAGERDLAPTMLAVAKLSQLAKEADIAKNAERASGLRQRAEQLLTAFATSAEKDPSIAFSLGTAYTQSGDPAKGELWLRKALAARPQDPDVMHQLGKALVAQSKLDEALQILRDAVAAAPTRLEISLELARTYALAGKNGDAEAVFDKLVAAEDASIEARGHAGKFYAKLGKLDKAGAQGEKILAVDKDNAAGHFLKGEGLLADKQYEAARREFTEAVRSERDPQYLDGQGRATEKLAMPVGSPADPGLQEAAVRAYQGAAELDPTMLNPLVGQGRILVAQRASKPAVEVLLKASKLKQFDPEITFLLGVAYDGVGEKKTAKQWLQSANELAPKAQAHYLLGRIYELEDNNRRAAMAAYGAAYRLAREEAKKQGTGTPPWYPDAVYLHAQFSADENNDSDARAAFEEYLSTNPTDKARIQTAQQKLKILKGR
jgi:Flp pilus assembly protein TadD